jgi:hypothetical protein
MEPIPLQELLNIFRVKRSTPASSSCPRSTARRLLTVEDLRASAAASCTRRSRRWSTATARSAASARRASRCRCGHLRAPLRRRHAAERASSWPTTCPATCAAAPATGRSSTPASACSTCRPRALDTAPVVAALRALAIGAGLAYEGPPARTDASTRDRFEARALARRAARAHPKARLLAGSTDIGLWVNKQFRDLGDILYVGDVDELRRIERTRRRAAHRRRRARWKPPGPRDRARARAAPTCGCASPRCRSATPARWAATSPTARRSATRAGADGARRARRAAPRRARSAAAARRLLPRLHEEPLQPGEFVQASTCRCRLARRMRAYKLSKRFDCDISAVCAGFAIELDGGRVRERALRVRRHGGHRQARGERRGRVLRRPARGTRPRWPPRCRARPTSRR